MLYGPRTSRSRARASSIFPNPQYGLFLPFVPIRICSPPANYYSSYFLLPKEKPATHLGSNRPRVAGCTTGSDCPKGCPQILRDGFTASTELYLFSQIAQ